MGLEDRTEEEKTRIKANPTIDFEAQTFNIAHNVSDGPSHVPNTRVMCRVEYGALGRCESRVIMEGFIDQFKVKFRPDILNKIINQVPATLSEDGECDIVDDVSIVDSGRRKANGDIIYDWVEASLAALKTNFSYTLTEEDFFVSRKQGPMTEEQKQARQLKATIKAFSGYTDEAKAALIAELQEKMAEA